MLKRVACTLISLVLLAGIARAGPGTLRLTFYGVNGNNCDPVGNDCDFEIQSIFAYTTSSGTTTAKVSLGEKADQNSPRWNYIFAATYFPTFTGSITFSIDLMENDSLQDEDYNAVTYNVPVTAGAAAKDVTLGGFWYVTNVYINVQFNCSTDYYGSTCDTYCTTNSGNCNSCNSTGGCSTCATGYSGPNWPCTATPNWCTIPGTAVGGGTRSCANTINGVCSTSCNTGYTLSAGTAASTTCLSSQVWSSGNPGVCVVNNNYCTAKAAPTYGQMSCTNIFALNSVCSFSCSSGYTFAGSSSFACNSNTQASGSWSAGTDPTCTPITNFSPTVPVPSGDTSFSTTESAEVPIASIVTASSASIASQASASVASDVSGTSVLLASVVSTASASAASVASSIVQHSSDTQASASAAAVAAAVAFVAVVAIIAAVLIVLRRRRLQRRSAARPKNAVKDSAGPVYQEAIEMTTSPLAHPTPEPTDSANPIYHEASELTGSSMPHSTRAHRAEGSSSAYATAGQRQPEPLYQAIPTAPPEEVVYDYASAYVAGSNSRRVREGLTIVKHLASGNFGDVALGQVPFSVLPERARTLLGPAAPETVQVAVKSLKSDADEKSRKDFESEAKLMAPFVHLNVVRLLAALVESEPHLVLLEFVQYGDLRTLLQKSKKQSFKWSENEQIHAIRQIALGMEYLGTLHFVHRDLAARNCLVGQGMVVKIADFGLSRELADENDYYRMETRGKLPVKWMAPETMTFRKFSSMSDVWSFGVTAWECCCYGEMPYGKLSGRDTLAHVEAGGRLPQPEHCMLELYNMMMSCWNMTPEFRPSFSQLVKVLAGFQDGTTIREIGAMV
ncbi:proto-oncogene tyrosine-protein kinase LCK [Capsaspora owczarzaki ATCC 30864]|uniref:TKL protein kinase n=1 Tax=Capsaspora owczarzaki (strain ATCC 30864) TaxID=595528 RepID=A0A0D2VWD7_CAPO3|nr:proto-oncogene tyrosine-protein kinase LCK [Capsaspora owczarzaki ATCC 30864]KJE95877.1 TKL protein kinase [Capsaspora owczarzaki ATCC 30864]|eukprot:XP_004345029.1 proto-oncogene tyrosine-protein kinase LCK [Capsaspora owczarzaki ATCC 30864]